MGPYITRNGESDTRYIMEDGLLSKRFDTLVTETINHWRVPGLAFAMVSGYNVDCRVRVAWSILCGVYLDTFQGYGISRYPDEKVTPSTLFNCASLSKAFTAAAISLLVDDNENHPTIQWTAPVSSIIPDDFVLSDAQATKDVTVEDMLSHRTGMPR
jgi:CubicO group peptidase (beta-lactamase class C family)